MLKWHGIISYIIIGEPRTNKKLKYFIKNRKMLSTLNGTRNSSDLDTFATYYITQCLKKKWYKKYAYFSTAIVKFVILVNSLICRHIIFNADTYIYTHVVYRYVQLTL